MFKKLSAVVLAGVLVVAGGGLAVALAGNNITTAETLVLTETNLKGRGIDVGKKGFGPGDSFIFVNSLTDPADGSRVGTVRGQCTIQIGAWQTCQVGGFIDGRGRTSSAVSLRTPTSRSPRTTPSPVAPGSSQMSAGRFMSSPPRTPKTNSR